MALSYCTDGGLDMAADVMHYVLRGSLNGGFGNRGFRVTWQMFDREWENLGLVIPKQKFSHECKAHFHDSENRCLQNPF